MGIFIHYKKILKSLIILIEAKHETHLLLEIVENQITRGSSFHFVNIHCIVKQII
jgi:hypothetical protein